MLKIFDKTVTMNHFNKKINMKSEQQFKPFIKRVWGKRQLLSQFESLYPSFNPKKNLYFEPFLWWWAVFFDLRNRYWTWFHAYLCDINTELINTYEVIRDNTDELIKQLKEYRYDKDFFLEIRAWDREENFQEKRSPIERASRFIYLNKTCYNWMYRVNKSWYFNVPFWDIASPNICNEETLYAAKDALQNTTIKNWYFFDIEDLVKKWDFAYFDPPYDVLSTTSSFTDYIEWGFWWEDQIRLKECFDKVTEKWCNAMLSNHNTKRIQMLYEDYNQKVVSAKRFINSDATKRWAVEEIVVLNY